jgi:tetratricopeptide (TPR) repeat protein
LHDRDNTALCYHNLALIALRRNDTEKASAFVAEGKALNSERESLHFALDDPDIAAARGQWTEAERLFKDLSVRTRKDEVVYSSVQQNLGKVYWHEHQTAQANQMFREGIQTAEKALAEFKRPEDRMSFMDRRAFYDPYIQFLSAQNKPMEALRIAERSRAQVLAAALENGKAHARGPFMSIAALQGLAKRRGQVILAYAMTDEKTFLWVITASRFKPFELPGHSELSFQIEACNKEIQDHRNL